MNRIVSSPPRIHQVNIFRAHFPLDYAAGTAEDPQRHIIADKAVDRRPFHICDCQTPIVIALRSPTCSTTGFPRAVAAYTTVTYVTAQKASLRRSWIACARRPRTAEMPAAASVPIAVKKSTITSRSKTVTPATYANYTVFPS